MTGLGEMKKSFKSHARVGAAGAVVGAAGVVAGNEKLKQRRRGGALVNVNNHPPVAPVEKADDKKARGVTAGLSAVGATAGVAGLGYAAGDALKARRLGTKIPGKTKALIPLEVAGLGGELMATKILHGDAKKAQVGKEDTSVVFKSDRPRDGSGTNLNKSARRYDPEADRQRRQGLYAGAGAGGAAVLGQASARKLGHLKTKDSAGRPALARPGMKELRRAGKTRTGALLGAGALASGVGGAVAYRRGISQRNQPWN